MKENLHLTEKKNGEITKRKETLRKRRVKKIAVLRKVVRVKKVGRKVLTRLRRK